MTPARRKPYKGLPMEGFVATWYASNTRGDRRRYSRDARTVAEQTPPGGSVLEVAPGPGYLAIELAKLGPFRVTGLDISRSFVRIASENARKEGVKVDFRHGDAANMPFPDGSFDFAVCSAAFKNFADPVGALDEIHRVLKPGGRASIFDLRKEASLKEIDEEVERMNLSRLNALLTRWTFRNMLLRSAYTNTALQHLVARSRFGRGEIAPDGIGFELRLAR
jgi:ubiquinone/menaquinone biosynthesis C-methylase UbiE